MPAYLAISVHKIKNFVADGRARRDGEINPHFVVNVEGMAVNSPVVGFVLVVVYLFLRQGYSSPVINKDEVRKSVP